MARGHGKGNRKNKGKGREKKAPAPPATLAEAEARADFWEDFPAESSYTAGQLKNDAHWTAALSDDTLMSYLNMKSSLHLRLVNFTKHFINEPLSLGIIPAWQCMPVHERRIFVVRLLENLPAPTRAMVPDMTRQYLAEGTGFEDLLSSILDRGILACQEKDDIEPILYCPAFDTNFSIERTSGNTVARAPRGVLFSQAMAVMSRDLLLLQLAITLSHALIGLDIYPTAPHLYPVRKPVLQSRKGPKRVVPRNQAPSRSGKFGASDEHRSEDYEEGQRGGPELCDACGRERQQVKELVEEDRPFLHCLKCATVNRRHPYCSRDCQLQHHKAHKKICGKVLADVVPTPSFPPAPANPRISPIAPLWQHQRQNLVPYCMYTLMLEDALEGREDIPDHCDITMKDKDRPGEETDALKRRAEGKPLKPSNGYMIGVVVLCMEELERLGKPHLRADLVMLDLARQVAEDFGVREWWKIPIEVKAAYERGGGWPASA